MDGYMAEDLLRWGKTCAYPLDNDWVLICLSLRFHIFRKSFGMYGGDDGARTRDLCRDRAAL
jgi:hypothetical protein